ncbi:Su(z)12 [Carabus blaptoides fortunei]
MPPKKREKDGESSKNPRLDHIQADHELFLQAFEKPTQIYRFLRTRNMLSPIFLNRTLLYMKQRMSRTHKARRGFKVDSLLERVSSRRNDLPSTILAGYMTLTFLGFYDRTFETQSQTAQCLPNNTITTAQNDTDDEPALKRRKSTSIMKSFEGSKLYASELIVYDKHNRCLLTDGDYELGLQDVSTNVKTSPRKHSSWECITDLNESYGPFDNFTKGPILKFKLCWTQEPSRGFVNRPKPFPVSENKENIPQLQNNNMKNQDKLQIVYQFLYNNNSRQQTEACEDLHCPWCSVNCLVLYALLKHLKLCHSRFTFTYVPITQGARIDVAINELYDGSYTGSPHDLISQPSGCAFSRNGPVRRASVTHILVCRPKRTKPSLSEFLELDDVEYDGQRPYITGHNRLYHHTTTCLPIYPKEMDMDSEGENDPEWLQTKTMMMIDEFTDVNEGEKELMKMWNLHVMKHGYVGDCQIPLACSMFLQTKGKELLLKNLYRNFVLHMCSLFDFGLISPVILYNTVKKLQDLVGETGAIRKVLRESREAQMDNWIKSGVFQQPVQDRGAGSSKTPTTGRKAAPPGSGQQRRKGTPSTVELPLRRKSGGETSRKRLSLTLKKEDTQGKPLSS